MARTVNNLSALKVARLSAPGWYCDGQGLWLQVSSSGSKSWVYRYEINGRRHHMGLGSLRDVSLAQAREAARESVRRVRAGANPLAERRDAAVALKLQEARTISFDACAHAYIAAHRASWRNPKHAQQWENTLATYVSPVFGPVSVGEVDTALVVKALQPIWIDKTETATRLRGRIESILDWATVSKFRAGENPARWRGHLEFLFANPNEVAPVVNRPALPWIEAPAFMAQLRDRDGISARALEFLIYTAGRSNEVRGATWTEIDMDDTLWTVPAERMKAGREHRVPLARPAAAALEKIERSTALIFPGRKGTMLPCREWRWNVIFSPCCVCDRADSMRVRSAPTVYRGIATHACCGQACESFKLRFSDQATILVQCAEPVGRTCTILRRYCKLFRDAVRRCSR